MGGYSSQTERNMKAYGGRLRMRPWTLLVLVGVIGLVGHSAVLDYVLSHTALSATVAGVIVLIVIMHLGLFGPLYALFRRRSRY
jgi:hypothetical protein